MLLTHKNVQPTIKPNAAEEVNFELINTIPMARKKQLFKITTLSVFKALCQPWLGLNFISCLIKYKMPRHQIRKKISEYNIS